MIIRFVDPAGTVRVVLLEVKKTSDDEYARSSVYKCLGYLRICRFVVSGAAAIPRNLLLFPAGNA